jgi:hypothetical protein
VNALMKNMRAILNPHLARRAPAGEEDMARSSHEPRELLGRNETPVQHEQRAALICED